jgi:hypothetical protein
MGRKKWKIIGVLFFSVEPEGQDGLRKGRINYTNVLWSVYTLYVIVCFEGKKMVFRLGELFCGPGGIGYAAKTSEVMD